MQHAARSSLLTDNMNLQDDLQDGAGPSADQQADAPELNALEEEAAAAARPDQNGADGQTSC